MTRKNEKQRPWTAEELDTLRRERQAGLKVTEIAEMMGRTHCSILSKIDLLKIKVLHHRQRGPVARPTQRIRPPEAFILYGEGKSLLDIGAHECRFKPEGHNVFCAAPANGPYCKNHTRICYV